MKRILLLLTGIISFSVLMSQETLIKRGLRIGAFGAPIIEFSDLDGSFGVSVGGGGAIMIEHFFIGGYGMGSTHDILKDIDADEYDVTLAHGGLWTGFDLMPSEIIHMTTSFRAGWGVLLFGLDNDFSNYDFEDQVFTLTPEIGIELNVTRFFKIAATGGYRWVKDVDISPYEGDEFDSFTGSLVFKFGEFNNRSRHGREYRHW